MRKSLIAVTILASAACANSLPTTRLHGDYIEARTADVYTGPCFANGEVDLVGDLAVFGWRITEGNWRGVKLDGLGVVGVVKASATLGDRFRPAYPVKSVLIIDERAGAEQRLALRQFAQHMSKDLLQDIVRVEYRPISLTFQEGNMYSSVGTLKAGDLAEIATRAIGGSDCICTNEEIWYEPLTKLEYSVPAVTVAHRFAGQGLGSTWSSPYKRSAFLGTFHFQD